jgi:seryl-tRNA synthetase
MKKMILGGLMIFLVIGFSGCGKSKEEKALDKFTNQMEDVSKDFNKELKQLNKTMEEDGAAMGKMMKKNEKTTKEKLKETKDLKECLTKASTKNKALSCYGDLEGKDFTNNEAAAMNTGIREWTADDKEQSLKQTDMLIKMIEMQIK